jgi:hypothetical protein
MRNPISRLTTKLESGWEGQGFRRARSISLVVVLIGGAGLIEVARWIWPIDRTDRPEWLPVVHLAAITWAINLLLIYELVDMSFAISKSVSTSVARHLQIYALVLLRDAFLKLESFPEPIDVAFEDMRNIGIMVADAAGGVILFVAAGLFTRLQRHTPITLDSAGGERFRDIKRAIVFMLLIVLASLCVLRPLGPITAVSSLPILETFFTVLVFVDILLAFVSLAFTTNPAIVFRNFGFAFSAILLRLALSSPEFIRPAMGVAGAIFAIAMTLAYNLATDAQGHNLNPESPSPPTPTTPPSDPS